MSATVTLTVTHGPLTGNRFVFRDPTLCSMGRAWDCDIQMPNDPEFFDVSRHHCVLDIEPPLVRISDYGSKNGTFVNEVSIGQREKGKRAEDVSPIREWNYDLKDGDQIRLGRTVLEVGVSDPPTSPECGDDFSGELETLSDDQPEAELCSQRGAFAEAEGELCRN
jgi:pSer/pThr/pTyr-binding forkhead associated (FHA) protein